MKILSEDQGSTFLMSYQETQMQLATHHRLSSKAQDLSSLPDILLAL